MNNFGSTLDEVKEQSAGCHVWKWTHVKSILHERFELCFGFLIPPVHHPSEKRGSPYLISRAPSSVSEDIASLTALIFSCSKGQYISKTLYLVASIVDSPHKGSLKEALFAIIEGGGRVR